MQKKNRISKQKAEEFELQQELNERRKGREREGILRKQVMLEDNKKRQREVGQRLAMQRLCLTEID